MRILANYLRDHSDDFGLETKDLVLRLRAPWRRSRISRCSYTVHDAQFSSGLLVIQDSLSLEGIKCRQNPYEPAFHASIESILPISKGAFELSGRNFFWANQVDYPSLAGIAAEKNRSVGTDITAHGNNWQYLAANIASEIGNLQLVNAAESHNYSSLLIDLCHEKIANPILQTYFDRLTQPLRDALRDGPVLGCAWGHGDLWIEDIRVDTHTICVLDWEWAVPAAPMGTDLIDLYITCAEHILKLELMTAWSGVLHNQIPVLHPLGTAISDLWKTAGYGPIEQNLALAYALLRSIGRVIAQDGVESHGYVMSCLDVASQLLSFPKPEILQTNL